MSVDFPAPGGPVMPMTTDLASAPARAVLNCISTCGSRSIWLRSRARLARSPAIADASNVCVVGALITVI